MNGLEGNYKETCERLLKLLAPDMRRLSSRTQPGAADEALTAREIELVARTCDTHPRRREIRLEHAWASFALSRPQPIASAFSDGWEGFSTHTSPRCTAGAPTSRQSRRPFPRARDRRSPAFDCIPGRICFTRQQGKIRNISATSRVLRTSCGRIACEFRRGA